MRDAAVLCDVAQALARALSYRADVELAVLFGSHARGEARMDSDVDLAVAGTADRLTLAAELSRATGRELHVVDLAAAGYPLLAALVEDGVVVHEGVRSAYGHWLSRALSVLELDRAAYTRMRDGYLAKLAQSARR
jgi:predicted nucleotidyltransferase